MTVPGKKRGFRKIVVAQQTFNWSFRGIVDIRLPENPKAQALQVDFGFKDPWLHFNDPEKRNFEPKIVTPKFVAAAIQFALKNNWNPRNKSGIFKIKFKDGKFTVDPANL